MNIKERFTVIILIIIFMSGSVMSQMGRRTDRGSREGGISNKERNVGRTEKDPNSIEEKEPEKEQTLEQRVESLEKELNKLTSRIKILELDNEILFFELITFRATVYRENIINDIQKNRDTRTQEEKWNDYGYYPIIIRNGE